MLEGDFANFRVDHETNVLGSLGVAREFAPVLARNGGGSVLNVLSALSWLASPGAASYSASKYVPKSDPADIARLALKRLDEGSAEILADDVSEQVKAALAQDLTALYPQFAEG